ncbi:hypothetical protein M406DRAFT_320002 [Cryphonectria parasitica EP155]|uniref:Ubiquinol-cytochrome c chaperone domain-containing protein n=1 Tax=Cryphonectria parasitica (strain ATCC 38755 / EP155) TaxID=660469 RepID=A0A9P4YAU8_CRYP1|nr:uncharacterized protein M406DRAFT_320002 [Cryphonectria parasitica EP155]KAF3769631.1 hypothetical protein M406DRAFT_320002 [Cryphonectria parasitica EP155]
MANQLCRPCRDLARRQLRALIELNYTQRTSVADIARHSRRAFHQTTARREEKSQPASAPSGLSKTLLTIASAILPRRAVQPYAIYGATETMYKACSKPAAYTISEELRKKEEVPMTEDGMEIGVGTGVWYEEFGLVPTFSTWSQVTMLHLYLIVVRLRCLEKNAWQAWQTQLVNHFFQHAEDLMEINHGMKSRMIRSGQLNSLFQTWRGVILAYDEGLVKGDAVMAAAVWRNVFMSREDVDMRHVAAIVSWMRSTLRSLDQMLDPALLYHGGTVFKTQPTAELKVVDQMASLNDVKPASVESAKQPKSPASRFG